MSNYENDIFSSDSFFVPNLNQVIGGKIKILSCIEEQNENSNSGSELVLMEEESIVDFPENQNKTKISLVPDEKFVVDKKEDCFPFIKGQGLEKSLKKKGIIPKSIKSKKINRLKHYCINNRFKTIKYDNKGKKIKNTRKYDPDNIKKKIKNKIHKALLQLMNTKLKDAGSKETFKQFPQSFIKNMSIEKNKKVLKLTIEELIENTEDDENIKVLNYLKDNPEISEKSGFNIIKKMKYMDIIKAYFISREFEESVEKLYDKEDTIYIEKYVNNALIYLEYYIES